jgi:peptide/nickel transport system ATP-binding protein
MVGDEPSGLLQVEHLSVEFPNSRGPVKAVRDVSFTLPAGQCLALVGESGSGKSATARALVGLAGSGAHVAARTLRYKGDALLDFSERQWRALRGREIGMVLQDAQTSLDPLRRVRAEVAEPLEVHGLLSRKKRAERVIELLEQAGIPDPRARAEQYPHELSGGLRQRALIASALAGQPSLLIADEPTTALDATVQAEVLELLATMRDIGLAIVLISHDLSVVARMADRTAVMYAGMVVEQGLTQQILADPSHPYTAALLAAAPSLEGRSRRALSPPTSSLTIRDAGGCPYAGRCPSADARCAAELPELIATR